MRITDVFALWLGILAVGGGTVSSLRSPGEMASLGQPDRQRIDAVGAGSPSAAQEPTLAIVLERAAAYVADFHRQLSSIVAEEHYVQEWRTVWSGKRGTTNLGHRELRSDLLLLKTFDANDWLQYRDVYEVDGTAVRDRQERLANLFRENSASSMALMRTILDASARYNIGDIVRNVNTPLFPLKYLLASNQGRFTFKRTADATAGPAATDPEQAGAFRVSTEVWVVAYQEKKSDTIIRTETRRDFPSRGRFWIEPATGRVLMSELTLANRHIKVAIDVSYQSEPLLGLLVPIEMRERYEGARLHSLIECRAVYGKFRQINRVHK
jgi:hypothetical protein